MNAYASLITKGLSEKHGYILSSLLEEGDRPISEFAPFVMVTKASMTLLVDRLDSLGFTRRIDHKDDRRIKLVSLTPKGRSFAKSLNR
jgi:DNA-binding MarR family transcriptional regulator